MKIDEAITNARRVASLADTISEIKRTKWLLDRCYIKDGFHLAIVERKSGGTIVVKDLLDDCCPINKEIDEMFLLNLDKNIEKKEKELNKLLGWR